ncbi:nep-22 [Pristionchus pacificus]|nr:nep-22 [Pristionchus pacificus]
MSKLLGFTVVLVVAALGVAIASLVFNILVFNKINESDDVAVDPTATPSPTDGGCPGVNEISKEDSWKEAANRIIDTIDLSSDPCEDFYQFSCGKYLQDTDLQGMSRKGTYDEAQYEINLALADYFDGKALKDLKSNTEKYQKNFLQMCYADAKAEPSEDITNAKWDDLTKDLNADLGFPLFGVARKPQTYDEFFRIMGDMERKYTGGPLMTSFVTADFKDNNTNALYINQPALHFTRDYFVKPQFIDKLQAYADQIRDLILAYGKSTGKPLDYQFCPTMNADDKECATQVAQWAVNIERSIAMSSWPDTELRNYKQQYTPFDDLDILDYRFQQLSLGKYVRGLLQMKDDDKLDGFKVVISQATYFAALDGQFDAGHISLDDYTDYLAIHFLMDNAAEYGIDIPSADGDKKKNKMRYNEKTFDKYITRRGFGARKITRRPLNSRGLAKSEDDEIRTRCVDTMIDYMPYGPGYTYVRNRADRDDVRKDVQIMTENIIEQFSEMLNSLDWIDPESLGRAHAKSGALVRNYLWPDSVFGPDFNKFDTIDGYNKNYAAFADTTKLPTYWDALKTMKLALMKTEQWDIVAAGGDRTNFLQSPATVNAWYQPERNSITFPFGILNPPYYNLNYPQAYNYAGQGGTAGHELTHGYDDEGTQFDEFGMLADCEFTHCSILDDDSRSGFVDMAQCVVQQFNTQCCPVKKGNVRCANGDTTQGENIADIGGEQAAYRAYQKFMADQGKTELRLPGLEQFSPKQIFWLTYGVSWCMKITEDRLVRQLMTDPHAPSSCRVNQVMQDIPQFGMDWKCKRGVSPMYPNDDDRCKVWVGF